MKPRLSCSMQMQEWLIHDGQTVFTVGAEGTNATLDDDATVFKTGTESAQITLHGDCTAGATATIAYSAGAVHEVVTLANDNLATLGVTHIKYWGRSDLTVDAGAYTLGLSNTAGSTGDTMANIPALAADAWTRCVVPLTTAQKALSSLSGILLNYITDTGDADNLYLDDIRLCKYVTSGNSSITLPTTSTINNTNGDNINTDVWLFPYRSRVVTITSDVGLDVTFYVGSNAAWASSDVVQGQVRVEAGVPREVTVEATSMSFVRDHDLHKLAITADATGTLVGGKVIVEVSQ